ncbi:MFS transporter [Limnohabitans lacus]|uniref:MFS transporter n=1 Tax=Limnohabitans lacus TaxID=3045173 RepID=A0ABT6XA11_9BURK|nr:MFS transporter [Limnohabitans sp. HM2-2]MDI9234970.1 MFS transporter [Limnohabitans sp. HM2-2]
MKETPYAWVVVWATFVCLALIFGVSYSFAAFFESFAAEFSAQRADVSWIFGLSGFVYFVLGAGGGMLADRFGPRIVCSAGMALIALGLLATSWATSLLAVYVSYGLLVGLGIALVYTPSIASVQPWFTTRRGLAGGIASSGVGAGTLLVPVLVALAIGPMPWREAMRSLALGVLVLGLLAAALLRRAPAALTSAASAGPGVGGSASGLTLGETLRSPTFRWLYLAVVLASPVMFIPFAHVSASARDLGLGEAFAVGLVGLIGVGSLVGRFAIGLLADRLGRAQTLVLLQLSMGASYVLWGAAGGQGLLVVFALWFGLSYGSMVSLLPAICMDYFGGRSVAGVVGTLYSGAALGNLLGPVLAGAAFDGSGHYLGVMVVCGVLSLIATWASLKTQRSGQVRY